MRVSASLLLIALSLFGEGDFFDPPTETGHVDVIGDFSLGCQLVIPDYHLSKQTGDNDRVRFSFCHTTKEEWQLMLFVDRFPFVVPLEPYVEADLYVQDLSHFDHEISEAFLGGKDGDTEMIHVASESWNERIQQLYFVKGNQAFSFYMRAKKKDEELVVHQAAFIELLARQISLF